MCHCCGKQFNELALVRAALVPDPWLALSDTERETRGNINKDVCIIDREQFYVRGCLDVPIIDHDEVFSWGVWVSVSREKFVHINDMWDAKIPSDEPPIFGWLCNNIENYPATYGLKTNLHLRNHNIRPFIELEPTDHPLAIEQREGITLRRVEEIIAATRTH
jgi:hypothetical protein